MRFLVITNAPTLKKDGLYNAYAPYVNEMNIWFKYVDTIAIISPISYNQVLQLSSFKKQPYVISIPSLNFTSLYNILKSIISFPVIVYRLIRAMSETDHIHLRCPGNIGLLGCFVQILFPNKIKTAKYAGNWDPKAKQPLSYKLQKWILKNTFLTRNMSVFVYGEWCNQSKNIKPFFTATYKDSEIEIPKYRNYNKDLQFVFVGSLVKGKRPLLAIKTVEALSKQGYKVQLDIYGEGVLKMELETYILENKLKTLISLHGNQPMDVIKKVFQKAHFILLPSKSEGWPKAIAEAMFFGVIPIATKISCVPNMLDNGNRGILISAKLEEVVAKIKNELMNEGDLKIKSNKASYWSQNYTLDRFESEIAKILRSI